MKIRASDQALAAHQADRARLQQRRDEDYRQVVERRKFDRVQIDRVQRNIRLGLDKGRQIDVEC
jgi:hypothetical protein